jgi:hypothetical protein
MYTDITSSLYLRLHHLLLRQVLTRRQGVLGILRKLVVRGAHLRPHLRRPQVLLRHLDMLMALVKPFAHNNLPHLLPLLLHSVLPAPRKVN